MLLASWECDVPLKKKHFSAFSWFFICSSVRGLCKLSAAATSASPSSFGVPLFVTNPCLLQRIQNNALLGTNLRSCVNSTMNTCTLDSNELMKTAACLMMSPTAIFFLVRALVFGPTNAPNKQCPLRTADSPFLAIILSWITSTTVQPNAHAVSLYEHVCG